MSRAVQRKTLALAALILFSLLPFFGHTPRARAVYSKFDDRDPGMIFSSGWTRSNNPSWYSRAYNSTITYTNVAGASLEFSFNGDRATIFFTRANNRGDANVFKDNNVFADVLEGYADQVEYQVAKTIHFGTPGPHKIKIVAQGNGYFDIDAITVDTGWLNPGTYDDKPSYTHRQFFGGGWTRGASFAQAYAGTDSFTNVKAEGVWFTCSCYRFKIKYVQASNRGWATITMDDSPTVYLNQYSPTTNWNAYSDWYYFRSDIGAIHNVMISNRNGGSYIDIDAIIIE
jgi:hypothetical protein